MTDSPKEVALAAFWSIEDAKVRDLVIQQAEERIRGRLSALLGLEQRAGQAASILLAASAVIAAMAFSKDASVWSKVLAAASSVAFAVGGLLAMSGLKARYMQMPGIPPSHWEHASNRATMKLRDGQYFVLAALQDTLDDMASAANWRADRMNLALIYGVVGGALACLGAIAAALS